MGFKKIKFYDFLKSLNTRDFYFYKIIYGAALKYMLMRILCFTHHMSDVFYANTGRFSVLCVFLALAAIISSGIV